LKTDFPKDTHPEDAVKAIYRQNLTSDEIIYRDVKEVFSALTQKTEEGRQKNFLGRYKSQLVLDWQMLMRIYEKDFLFLAEYGKIV